MPNTVSLSHTVTIVNTEWFGTTHQRPLLVTGSGVTRLLVISHVILKPQWLKGCWHEADSCIVWTVKRSDDFAGLIVCTQLKEEFTTCAVCHESSYNFFTFLWKVTFSLLSGQEKASSNSSRSQKRGTSRLREAPSIISFKSTLILGWSVFQGHIRIVSNSLASTTNINYLLVSPWYWTKCKY